jgi:UDP-2,4-diacetamido-2,4,6-trideoxy-beta-L-altropyranose hydrolase
MKTLLFRVDGKKSLGMGHIIRCLGLADVLRCENPELEILFLTKYEEGKNIIEKNGYQAVLVADDGFDEIKELAQKNALLITDFFDTDNPYISKIKKTTGLKIISIDNNTKLKKINSDILINTNVVNEGETKVIGSTRYFLGINYMILRKEFGEGQHEREIQDKVSSILVMSGGADDPGLTLTAVKALQDIPEDVDITVVLGPGFAYHDQLTEILSRTKRKFNIIHDPKNLIELMKKTDMAISAAGITMWELATLGVPSIVVPLADHQADVAKVFENAGACVNMGYTPPNSNDIYEATIKLMQNKTLREQLSRQGQKLVDGKGLDRVVNLIKRELET